jgi:DNA adenine methylase
VRYESPLRYPGGKKRLANFFKLLFLVNDLLDAEYVEPYAGGASVALALLSSEYASRVHINDLSRPMYAFWLSVLYDTEALCRRVRNARFTMREYRRQKALLRLQEDLSTLDLGFAAFFVNRTSRSGIMTDHAGPIGGTKQAGKWKLDARYNAPELVNRIERIARQRHRIRLYNLDAAVLLRTVVPKLPQRSFVYLDPPYFHKGQRLYANYYEPDDHELVATTVLRLRQPWAVSYDNVSAVRKLYKGHRSITYDIPYTASKRYSGREILFLSPGLLPPRVVDPGRLSDGQLQLRLRREEPVLERHNFKSPEV